MQDKITGYPDSEATAKAQAKRLSAAMGGKRELSHAQSLEMVAQLHGAKSWGEMLAGFSSKNEAGTPNITSPHEEKFLFTVSDYLMALYGADVGWTEDGWKEDKSVDLIVSECYGIFLDLAPACAVSTELLPFIERKIIEKMKESGFLDRKKNSDSMNSERIMKIILSASEEMVRSALARGTGTERKKKAEDIFWQENSKDVPFDLRSLPVNRCDKPDVNLKNAILFAHHHDRAISLLKRTGRIVVDLFSRDDLDDLSFLNKSQNAIWISRGKRAVNPVKILEYVLGNFPKRMSHDESEEVVAVVSMNDLLEHASGSSFIRKGKDHGFHIVAVPDTTDVVPRKVLRNVDYLASNFSHIWMP